LVRDNLETFTAAETTAMITKKKKPVIRQETSFQISLSAVWENSVSGMQEENMFYRKQKQKTCHCHCHCRSGRRKEDHISPINQLSDLCVRGRKRKQNTEVQELKQISGSTVRYISVCRSGESTDNGRRSPE